MSCLFIYAGMEMGGVGGNDSRKIAKAQLTSLKVRKKKGSLWPKIPKVTLIRDFPVKQ